VAAFVNLSLDSGAGVGLAFAISWFACSHSTISGACGSFHLPREMFRKIRPSFGASMPSLLSRLNHSEYFSILWYYFVHSARVRIFM
jgi:hypothetical protein